MGKKDKQPKNTQPSAKLTQVLLQNMATTFAHPPFC